MTPWRWSESLRGPSAFDGVPRWLAAFSGVAPWIAAAAAFALVWIASGRFALEEGTVFELPRESPGDLAEADAAALVLPSPRGTVVFFDDTRYVLSDEAQAERLRAQLKDVFKAASGGTLLALADASTACGDVSALAAMAKEAGADRMLIAAKKRDGGSAPRRAAERP